MNRTIPVLEALNQWAPVVWLRTNPYAYPSIEVVHIAAIGLVFGTMWIVDLRLLGAFRAIDARLLARNVLPWTVAGFFLAAASGLTMFVSRAGDLIANPMFVIKMGLLCLAGANAGALHARGPLDETSGATKLQALFSILVWLAVIFCGRWIAYV
jgi:hypothetical protein